LIQGCALTASNYTAHARVTAESFLEWHPEAKFSVLSVEDPSPEFSQDEPFEVLRPADIGIDDAELARRSTMYSTQGMVESMKPVLMRALLARDQGPVVLLDADSCVYGDLGFLEQLLEKHPVLLSPHALDPHPLWRDDGPEQIFLRAGVMNAGFVAAGPGGEPFLDWWSERTHRRCIFNQRRALLVSQTWLTVAVGMFGSDVLRDRGCNVAGWNLQSRDVAWEGEIPTIDGGPLRHFHFAASFDPLQPDLLTTLPASAAWWPALEDRPGVARLVQGYAKRLLEAGFERAMAGEPRQLRTPEGKAIEPWMRETYRVALMDAEEAGTAEPPNPYLDGGPPFFEWLAGRAAAEADEGGEDWGEGRDLVSALLDREELLGRITQLEGIRDDAIGWAERSDRRIGELEAELQGAETRLGQTTMEHERGGTLVQRLGRSPAGPTLRAARAAARDLRDRARAGRG
jgi:hypothetical protein